MTAVITSIEQLRELLREELPAALEYAHNKPAPTTLYTRAQVARLLGKSQNTIKNMIQNNRIQPTADGKYISQQAITNYITATSPNRPKSPTN